jgi:transcriptional regulator with XRE-family HTH domain
MKATGKNIESLRKRKNLSVKEIQEVFGFESPQAIYKWQWGDSLPSIDNLVVLATVFEVSIMNILVID